MTSYRQPRRSTMLCGILACAALTIAATCAGDATAPQAVAPDTPPASGEAAAPARQPARTLPLTPVSVAYHAADPSFEPLPGARAYSGLYSGGSYRIEVPDRWNGDVVYFAHGFRGNPPELLVDPPPVRAQLIERGFAWAASSYSVNGYEPGVAARDTFALRDVFSREAGAPRRSYLYGQSMGGHVTSLLLEQHSTAYDGALAECGVVSGHEILDYFLSWGAVAGYLSGADLGEVAGDGEALAAQLDSDVLPALGAPDAPSLAGLAFADVMQNLTGGPRPYFVEGFRENYSFNFGILVLATTVAGPASAAARNVDTQYAVDAGFAVTSDQINREIARIEANGAYRDPGRFPEFAGFSGRIERPVITIHNTGDLLVPISLEQSYRRIVDAAGNGNLLVQRAVRRAGHCAFTDAERLAAFDDLVLWAQGGPKPAGDDLRGDLRNAGRAFTLPLEPDDPGQVSVAPQ